MNEPSWFPTTVFVCPLATFLTETCAFGMREPVLLTIVPEIVLPGLCAPSDAPRTQETRARDSRKCSPLPFGVRSAVMVRPRGPPEQIAIHITSAAPRCLQMLYSLGGTAY